MKADLTLRLYLPPTRAYSSFTLRLYYSPLYYKHSDAAVRLREVDMASRGPGEKGRDNEIKKKHLARKPAVCLVQNIPRSKTRKCTTVA